MTNNPDTDLRAELERALDVPEMAIERLNRDYLGRLVREAWVKWAEKHPNPKAHWLLPYDLLDEPDKQADREIGEHLARIGASTFAATHRFLFRHILAALANAAQPAECSRNCDDPQCPYTHTPTPYPAQPSAPPSAGNGCATSLADRGDTSATSPKAASQPAGVLPADVIRLVIAARGVVFEDLSEDAMQELEAASEAFASRVCWDDEGGSLPDAHADPCTCGGLGGSTADVAIPAGMVPWHGGDSAPEDWQRGKPVLQRNGRTTVLDEGESGRRYSGWLGLGEYGIIAYTPQPAAPFEDLAVSIAREAGYKPENPTLWGAALNAALIAVERLGSRPSDHIATPYPAQPNEKPDLHDAPREKRNGGPASISSARRAREVLAEHAERNSYPRCAASIREGDDPYFNRVIIDAMLAFAAERPAGVDRTEVVDFVKSIIDAANSFCDCDGDVVTSEIRARADRFLALLSGEAGK